MPDYPTFYKQWRLLLPTVFLLALTACSFEPKDSCNIGDCKLSGSMAYDSSTKAYTLKGAGTNMWGASDEFYMAWKEVSGDFIFSSRIAFEGVGVNPHRKMGLIIRESLNANAVYADVAVHGDGLTSLQYRDKTGGETKEIVLPNKAPDYIVLERKGNKIAIKTAVGKYPSTVDAEVELEFPEACYVGLFVCSHEADIIETGYFSEVKLKQ